MRYPAQLTLGLGPDAASAAAARGDVIIIVDALRASSTIVTALVGGIRSIRAVATPEECVGDLTAGERGGRKIEQLDLDNSPRSFLGETYRGRDLVMTTTNGTACILAATSQPAGAVLIGSLLNCSAVAGAAEAFAANEGRNVAIVLAGRRGEMAPEDLIASSEMAARFPRIEVRGDFAPLVSHDFEHDFLHSPAGQNLTSLGLRDDVVFCAQKDRYALVPVVRDGFIIPLEIK